MFQLPAKLLLVLLGQKGALLLCEFHWWHMMEWFHPMHRRTWHMAQDLYWSNWISAYLGINVEKIWVDSAYGDGQQVHPVALREGVGKPAHSWWVESICQRFLRDTPKQWCTQQKRADPQGRCGSKAPSHLQLHWQCCGNCQELGPEE